MVRSKRGICLSCLAKEGEGGELASYRTDGGRDLAVAAKMCAATDPPGISFVRSFVRRRKLTLFASLACSPFPFPSLPTGPRGKTCFPSLVHQSITEI